MLSRRSLWLSPLLTALTLACITPALAQSGTIRVIVGTVAGGAIEPYARMIADHMSKTLGQTIIIENKPGASGALAAQYIADQPADGTTLWLGTQAFTEILPNLFPNAKWSIEQFRPIIRGVEAPLAFVATPSVPANNFAEFLKWAGENKGKLSYASYQPGTPSHTWRSMRREAGNQSPRRWPCQSASASSLSRAGPQTLHQKGSATLQGRTVCPHPASANGLSSSLPCPPSCLVTTQRMDAHDLPGFAHDLRF